MNLLYRYFNISKIPKIFFFLLNLNFILNLLNQLFTLLLSLLLGQFLQHIILLLSQHLQLFFSITLLVTLPHFLCLKVLQFLLHLLNILLTEPKLLYCLKDIIWHYLRFPFSHCHLIRLFCNPMNKFIRQIVQQIQKLTRIFELFLHHTLGYLLDTG